MPPSAEGPTAAVTDSPPAEAPPEAGEHFAYVPALDGLRGIAVAAVLLFHAGMTWAAGGFLGVEAFFVLSGFLITSLLVAEWRRTSGIKLRAFWARRARRLLPALVCVVAAVGIYQYFAGFSHAVPGLSGDGFATLLYYGNWHEVLDAGNYFVQTGPVSPLQHTWSLAIEEQFYLVWPLLLLAILWLGSRRARTTSSSRQRLLYWLALGSIVGAVLSSTEMALLFNPANSGRVYYGTDTRAQALLVGAALAFTTAYLRAGSHPKLKNLGARIGKRPVDIAGAIGLAILIVAIVRISGESSALYHYGFLLIDLAVLAVIASALMPGTLVGRLLAIAPLSALGAISYGVYLWHFPLFLWLTPSSTGASGYTLLVLRLAIVLAVATLSYFLIEQPIRRRRVSTKLLIPLAPAGAALAVGALLLGSGAAQIDIAATAPPNQLVGGSIPTSWYGTGPKCSLLLKDTSAYFEAPPPTDVYTSDLMHGVANHNTALGDSARLVFDTCPPKRVLFVGDSVAFTLAFGMLADEERYGVEIAGDPREACGFNTEGLQLYEGQYTAPPTYCATAIQHWVADERSFHADAVVVELGWRDEFDWQFNGQAVSLGDARFDASVRSGIESLIAQLGQGHIPILILTVPWADGVLEPDGSPAPQGSPQRHLLIDNMLAAAALSHPHGVKVLNIDNYVSPGDHFDQNVDGQLCRFDALHFTQFCAQLLEPYVLGEVRQMIADEGR
jgi:peptidoglycan/LPS O-acetylase OafA/YrhL